jgi:hypothetical protein
MTEPEPKPPKPLSQLQAYLVEVKTTITLLRDVCLEFKELLTALTMILFFTFGVYKAVILLLQ